MTEIPVKFNFKAVAEVKDAVGKIREMQKLLVNLNKISKTGFQPIQPGSFEKPLSLGIKSLLRTRSILKDLPSAPIRSMVPGEYDAVRAMSSKLKTDLNVLKKVAPEPFELMGNEIDDLTDKSRFMKSFTGQLQKGTKQQKVWSDAGRVTPEMAIPPPIDQLRLPMSDKFYPPAIIPPPMKLLPAPEIARLGEGFVLVDKISKIPLGQRLSKSLKPFHTKFSSILDDIGGKTTRAVRQLSNVPFKGVDPYQAFQKTTMGQLREGGPMMAQKQFALPKKLDMQQIIPPAPIYAAGAAMTGFSRNVFSSLKTVGKAFAKAAKSTQFWAMNFLTFIFVGMAIQQAFTRLATSASQTFMQVTKESEVASDGLTGISIAANVIKFSIGSVLNDALIPFLEVLFPILELVMDWIMENDKLVISVVLGGIALGFMIGKIANLMMMLNSVMNIFTVFGILIWNLTGGLIKSITAWNAVLIAKGTTMGATLGILAGHMLIIGAIALIVAALWKSNLGNIQGFVKGSVGVIWETFKTFGKSLWLIFKDVFGFLESLFSGNWAGIMFYFLSISIRVFGLFLKALVGLGSLVFNIFAWIWNTVIDIAFNLFLTPIVKLFAYIGGAMANALRKPIGEVLNWFAKKLTSLSEVKGFGWVGGIARSLNTSASAMLSSEYTSGAAGSAMAAKAGKFMNKIRDAITFDDFMDGKKVSKLYEAIDAQGESQIAIHRERLMAETDARKATEAAAKAALEAAKKEEEAASGLWGTLKDCVSAWQDGGTAAEGMSNITGTITDKLNSMKAPLVTMQEGFDNSTDSIDKMNECLTQSQKIIDDMKTSGIADIGGNVSLNSSNIDAIGGVNLTGNSGTNITNEFNNTYHGVTPDEISTMMDEKLETFADELMSNMSQYNTTGNTTGT